MAGIQQIGTVITSGRITRSGQIRTVELEHKMQQYTTAMHCDIQTKLNNLKEEAITKLNNLKEAAINQDVVCYGLEINDCKWWIFGHQNYNQ